MNTKGNAKAQQTTRRIIQAFYQVYREKGQVSKVTVREICQLAQINRTSFYLHFQDVFDLLEKVEKTMEVTMTETFLREIREEQDLGAGFEALFRFVGEHREFYVIYLGEAAHPVLNIARELYQAAARKDYEGAQAAADRLKRSADRLNGGFLKGFLDNLRGQ